MREKRRKEDWTGQQVIRSMLGLIEDCPGVVWLFWFAYRLRLVISGRKKLSNRDPAYV